MVVELRPQPPLSQPSHQPPLILSERSESKDTQVAPAAFGARCSRPQRLQPQAGFTLLEILIALAIMAFGVTVTMGMLTVATRAHKRAIDRTTAALIAETVEGQARGRLTALTELTDLAAVPGAPRSLYLRRKGRLSTYPDYVYDAILTPLDAERPADADAFHLEIRVRWRESGKTRARTYHTVVLRRLVPTDLEGP